VLKLASTQFRPRSNALFLEEDLIKVILCVFISYCIVLDETVEFKFWHKILLEPIKSDVSLKMLNSEIVNLVMNFSL
jgi:hypothetical protein